MTQPKSVNMTFDTSLVDLNPSASFSTTDSEPSDFVTSNAAAAKTPTIQQSSLSGEQTPSQSQKASMSSPILPHKPSTPIQYVATQDAYDQWASVYDSDGNMLVAIDNIELTLLLPQFLRQVLDSVSSPRISLLDLGCGSGRNTVKLLGFALPKDRNINVIGLDFSKGMLDVAAEKLQGFPRDRWTLEQCDCFPTVNDSSASPAPSVTAFKLVDGAISTLVLEHIPLYDYFSTLSSVLLPGGLALITNMHSGMGTKSQAGFINEQGVKIRGSSFAHTVHDTINEAQRAGFAVLSVKETEMTKQDVESGAVSERGRKWIGVKVWYGMIVRKAA